MSVCVHVCVCVCVCLPPKLLITSGVMWHDMNPHDRVNKLYSCYMVTVVSIINGNGFGIDPRRGN